MESTNQKDVNQKIDEVMDISMDIYKRILESKKSKK